MAQLNQRNGIQIEPNESQRSMLIHGTFFLDVWTQQTKAQQQQAAKVTAVGGAVKLESTTTPASTEATPISFTITLAPGASSSATATTTSAAVASTSTTASLSGAVTSAAVVGSRPGPPGAGATMTGVAGSAAARASLTAAASKDKEKKTFSSSLVGLSGDDDINDVAAMGGVNLAEESQRILGSTEMIGTQIRSCKDENFLHTGPLQRRIHEIGMPVIHTFLFLCYRVNQLKSKETSSIFLFLEAWPGRINLRMKAVMAFLAFKMCMK